MLLLNTGVIVAAALLVAAEATATKPKGEAEPSAATAQTKKTKKKAPPPGGKDAAASQKAATPGATPAQQSAVKRAKSTFMYAAESCTVPSRCDAVLRDDAEKKFLDACLECAPQDKCEAERDAIKGGSARSTTNPCAP